MPIYCGETERITAKHGRLANVPLDRLERSL
jgi:hypothetical protein